MQEPAESNKPNLPDGSTRLAVDRTRLAYDRTLMAWTRTAMSLITFGFSIYKFFQMELDRGVSSRGGLIGPREFALLMIIIGLVSLCLATLEHRRDLRALNAEYPGGVPRPLARVLAALISILGLVALIAVIFRE
jgi:putative membrane protein